MKRTLALGLALTVLVAALLRWRLGADALFPAALFGLVATGIQAGAGRAMRGASTLALPELIKRYGMGMGLRLLGVVLILVACLGWPALFVPVPTALGFLGVLIPMLFLETRLAR